MIGKAINFTLVLSKSVFILLLVDGEDQLGSNGKGGLWGEGRLEGRAGEVTNVVVSFRLPSHLVTLYFLLAKSVT